MKAIVAVTLLLSVAALGSTYSFCQEARVVIGNRIPENPPPLEMPTWSLEDSAELDSLRDRLTLLWSVEDDWCESGPKDYGQIPKGHGEIQKRLCFYVVPEISALLATLEPIMNDYREANSWVVGDSLGYDMRAPNPSRKRYWERSK